MRLERHAEEPPENHMQNQTFHRCVNRCAVRDNIWQTQSRKHPACRHEERERRVPAPQEVCAALQLGTPDVMALDYSTPAEVYFGDMQNALRQHVCVGQWSSSPLVRICGKTRKTAIAKAVSENSSKKASQSWPQRSEQKLHPSLR